jgi:hypothetical protein
MEREALKLALEALEESQTDNDTMEFWDRKSKAITAIKAALAQLVQEPVAWFRYENGMRIYYETKAWDDLQALYTTPPLPAQPVQEPVARVAEVHMSRYTLLDKPVREPVEKKEYTMGDWFNDLENPHGNR